MQSQQQTQQQVDMYGNMYQQQMSQPQYMCQPTPAMYQPFPPVTMAGLTGGTLVYYPNPAQSSAVDSSAQSQLQSQLQSLPVVQSQPQQMNHQVPHTWSAELLPTTAHTATTTTAARTAATHRTSAAACLTRLPAAAASGVRQQHSHVLHHSAATTTTARHQPSSRRSTRTSICPPPLPPARCRLHPLHPSPRDSLRSFSDVDKSCATYKTEICRSHQYSGACEYGVSCQFAAWTGGVAYA